MTRRVQLSLTGLALLGIAATVGGQQPPARRAARAESNSRAIFGKEQVGFKPLTEMTAEERYQGEEGGLYGRGHNIPPRVHREAAEWQMSRMQSLDKEGKPADDGRIVFVSISMSNATQEFSTFKRLADADPDKSPKLTIVDCAQGGQAMAEWVDPNGNPWQVADRRLAGASHSSASAGGLDQAGQQRSARRFTGAWTQAVARHAGGDSKRASPVPELADRLPLQPHLRRLYEGRPQPRTLRL